MKFSVLPLVLVVMTGVVGKAGEVEVVTKLIDDVKAASRQFDPVGPDFVRKKRRWLARTVDRLDDYIRTTKFQARVADWRERFQIAAIGGQLARRQPRPDVLLKIHAESFAAVEMDVDQGKYDAFDGAGPDSESNQDRHEGFHAVASLGRALKQYAVLQEDALDDDPSPRLQGQLDQLQARLAAYLELARLPAPDDPADPKNQRLFAALTAIDDMVRQLELRQQAGDLTAELRRHYLHPKLRAYVTTNVFDQLPAIRIPGRTVNQSQNGVHVRGVATPHGRIRVETVPHAPYGILLPRYRGPVVFRGTAQRKKICLGISASVAANVSKRFYVIQDAPDSAPASSRVALTGATSSRGHLVDGIVNRAARQNFNSSAISAQLQDQIDRFVTKAANVVNLKRWPTIHKLLNRREYPRQRKYRTTDSAIELVLLSGRQGFREPSAAPPEAAPADFALSLHYSVIHEFNALQNKTTLAAIRDKLAGNLGFELPGGRTVEIWFPDRQAIFATDEGDLKITFRVRPIGETGDGYICVIGFSAEQARQGVSLTRFEDDRLPFTMRILLDRDAAADPAKESARKEFEQTFRRRVAAILKSLQLQLATGRVPNVELRYESGYFTVAGTLDDA